MAGAEAPSAVLFDDIDLETLRPSFKRIVRVAMALFDAEHGDVMIRVGEHVWRTSGAQAQATPVSELVEQADDVLWIEDAPTDPRVVGRLDQRILERHRFYAGSPIRLADGRQVGVLSVLDRTPRPFEERLAKRLRDLAELIADDFQRHTAILARARAEAEAHAARATLASIVESEPMALVMTDKQMRIVRASPRWRQERGLVGADIDGKSIYDLFPGSQGRWKEGFERALAGHAVHGDRISVTLPDGRQTWIRTEHTPWRDATGEIGGLMLMSVDITDMVDALETASRTRQRLELALQIGDLYMWEADYTRMAVTAGGAASTLDYGRDMDFADVEDDNIWRIVHPGDRPAAAALWERYMTDGTPFRAEFRLLQMNGPHRWAQAAAAAIRDEAGEVIRVIGVIRDIDTQKRSEIALAKARDAAEAANRAKSEFLANMSHEIRTPLNGVMGVASALAKSDLKAPQREMVGLIESSAQTLESLLSDVLDLARIESGRLELKAEPFDLAKAAEDVGALFFPAAREKGLSFTVEVEKAAQGEFVGDAGRIRQILSNLVSNAVKFTAKGSVAVKVDSQTDVQACDEVLVLSVTDTGIGFDDEAATRLFERFEQADGSITRRYGGTGLGLAISHSLAQAMGGQLYGTSVLEEGSVFTLRLPLQRVAAKNAEAAEAAAPGQPEVDLSQFRVLLAEDHQTNRRVVELILGSAGVALTCVENGAEAVEAFETDQFDLILMDMQMPVMDGLTAIRTIRQREADLGRAPTLIYALTANAMPEHSRASADAGADGHLTKPITADALFDAVKVAALVDADARLRA